jgi:hypothetical protein
LVEQLQASQATLRTLFGGDSKSKPEREEVVSKASGHEEPHPPVTDYKSDDSRDRLKSARQNLDRARTSLEKVQSTLGEVQDTDTELESAVKARLQEMSQDGDADTAASKPQAHPASVNPSSASASKAETEFRGPPSQPYDAASAFTRR